MARGTNSLFVFLRSFYKDPKDTRPAVDLMKQTKIYPLGKQASAKPMAFHEGSGQSLNMLPRSDASAFEQLKELLDVEGSHLAGPDWLGMLAGLGIIAKKPFAPDQRTGSILGDAAKTAYKIVASSASSRACTARISASSQIGSGSIRSTI